MALQLAVFLSSSAPCSCSYYISRWESATDPIFSKTKYPGRWPPSAPDQLTLSSRRAPLRQGSCCAPASLRRTPAGFGPCG
ncbi:hypothetical protein QF56_004905 [Salmonella enterica subsp. enterica]|nr:hypothetical protein [Salmonella enterica subsp. enterica serovar Miami]